MLGLRALSGRWFSGEDDSAGAPATAVVQLPRLADAVSDRIQQSSAARIRLGGSPVTIVGIGPPAYNGIVNGVAVDFWLPLSALGPVAGSFAATTLERPQDHWFPIRARLRDSVSTRSGPLRP